MKESWISQKADKIQGYADAHNSKRFYEAVRTLYGPQSAGTSPLLSTNGTTLLAEKSNILNRWAQHFDSVLNRPSSINDDAIDRLPQTTINYELEIPLTAAETTKAIKQMSTGKTPGEDAIPADIYKTPTSIKKLTELFQ